jgi:transposase
MLGDITVVDQIYVACGYTDMRKSIDGLATLVREHFNMDPYEPALFLFCGRRSDRIKALMWEKDGFILLYKRLENGKFQWPRTEDELQPTEPAPDEELPADSEQTPVSSDVKSDEH